LPAFAATAEWAIARFAYDQCNNSPTVVICMYGANYRFNINSCSSGSGRKPRVS
jgi:hypothetical protein